MVNWLLMQLCYSPFIGQAGKADVEVPRSLVGVIIGKGGEMIKKITQDTGARVQLKPGALLVDV